MMAKSPLDGYLHWIRGRFLVLVTCLVLLVVLPATVVDGKILKYDNQVFTPGQVTAEIHPIKGSGGYIGLSDLSFVGVQGTTMMDTAVLQVPPACLENANTEDNLATSPLVSNDCQWSERGLGKALPDGSTAFCCTQDMVNDNQCTTVNRAIVNNYVFTGTHEYVQLTPGTTQSMYDIDIDDTGMFALLFMNCDQSGSSKLNGQVEWESYPGGYEVWQTAELEVAGDLEQMARTCDINVDFFIDGPTPSGGNEDDEMGFIKAIEDYLASLAETCTDAEISSFNTAFDDFHQCAGFDLQQFIEDLPSAVLGTVIECLVTMDWEQFEDMDLQDADELANIQVSDACLDFEFGANAVGYGFRQMSLYPDQTMKCFKAFAPKVPACTLQTYPIPIVGGWLKPAACMVGEFSKVMDDIFMVEMGIWDKCLPQDPQASHCENDCIYQGSVLMRGGNMAMPVSDTMKRLAAADNGKLQSALKRYELHLDECTDEWTGWTDFDATTVAERHSGNVGSTRASSGGGSSSGGGMSRGFFDFFMLLVGLLVGAVVAVGYERAKRKQAYKQTERQLEMTEGTYVDADNEVI